MIVGAGGRGTVEMSVEIEEFCPVAMLSTEIFSTPFRQGRGESGL